MTRHTVIIIVIFLLLLTVPGVSSANPTETGITGLIHVPSADTLDMGNLCLGVWGNISQRDDGTVSIMPISLTMGVGNFWELYGTYSNVLLNGQEDRSGRGSADIGSKIRFYGNTNSKFKLAGDAFLQRQTSEDPARDGITDIGTRLIASLKSDFFGYHLYGGYLFAGGDTGRPDEVLYGAGIEYSLTNRMRLLGEVRGASIFSSSANDAPIEASLGFQYYISPHLTFNASGGVGLNDAGPDMRMVVGFSTCQGIGTYIKPVPSLAPKPGDKGKKKEALKPVKIMPITPLLLKSLPSGVSVSKLEVPVDPEGEEIVIKPYGQIIIPSQQTVSPIALPPKFMPIRPQQNQPGGIRLAKPQAQQQYSAGTPVGALVIPVQQPPAVVAKVPVPDLNVKKLPQEVTGEDVGSEVSMAAKTPRAADVDYTLDMMEGVTPLYGIEIKGDKARVVPVATPSQPLLPEKMVVYRKFRFADGKFEFNMSELSDEVKKSIAEAAEQIRNDKNWVYIRIDGHTDSMGSVSYNQDLSLKRAIAVASYLITKEGIDPKRVFVKGMGETKHISDNATPEGRRMNRRFEILFLVPKTK